MKFLIALSIATLAIAGCGQSHSGDRPASTTPNSTTTSSLESALNSIPGQNSADTEALLTRLGSTDVQASVPVVADVPGLQSQIGYQQKMLYSEKAALDQAIKERNNTVHLGPDFLDAAAYGISSGALTWDFVRRIRSADGKALVSSSEVASGDSGASTVFATLRNAASDAAPVAIKATEIASAAVLGIFFVGKTVQLGKDVDVRFSDTSAIRYHRAKVVEAEKNLENAKQNLAAVYFPDKTTNNP